MRSDVVNGLLVRVVPKLLSWLMRLWLGTCKVTVHNDEPLHAVDRGELTLIGSFWHYSLVFVLYYLRRYPATVMVSASKDGEYIARLAGEFGFNSVRGSKNRRGVEALKGMVRAVQQGNNSAIVADGSQGPARVAQSGALMVAAKSGKPIVPIAWSAQNYFTINSWDRTAVPKPFSRVDICFGTPIYVPRKVNSEILEEYRCKLENELNLLYSKAWAIHGMESH